MDDPGRPALERWVLACAAGVIYYALARAAPQASPVWPAAGFGVAAALLWGPSAAAGVFLGAFLGSERAPLAEAGLPVAAAGAALIGAGAAVQALLGAALLRRLGSPRALMSSAREAAVFCGLAPAVALIGPVFELLALLPGGAPPGFGWARAGLSWWFSDAAGLLVVVPLVMAWTAPRARRALPTPARAVEALGAASILAGAAALGLSSRGEALLFVSFPAVFWILYRFGSRAATTVVAAIAAAAALRFNESSVLVTSAYLAALAGTAVLARAMLHEREEAVKALADEARAARRRVEMDRRTFEHLPTGLAILRRDREGVLRVVDINPAGLRLAGIEPDGERFEGSPLREMLPALYGSEFSAACASVLDDRAHAPRLSALRLGGEHYELTVFALSEREVGAVYENVTERKRAQRAVQDAASLLLLMIESVREYAIFRLDTEGRVASWSKGAELIFGWGPEEALGRPYHGFLPSEKEARSRQDAHLARSAEEGRVTEETWCRRKDNGRFWADLTLTALRDERGELLGHVVVVRDASRRRAAEAALAEQSAALARSNVELSQFAYVASHDLSAPLHKVKAFAERLKARVEPLLDDEGREYLARMMRAVGGMQSLIDGLLALARVTTRGGSAEPLDLATLARDVVDGLDLAGAHPGASVEIGPLPRIQADPLQMRQLLQNLISNALKFQPPGAKPVVRVRGGTAPGGLCELFVSDNGIGLDMKFAERIFQPFQRLNSAFDYEGSGMGLAICRKIVSRHGGSIGVSSKPGHGTEFKVTLPVSQKGRLDIVKGVAAGAPDAGGAPWKKA